MAAVDQPVVRTDDGELEFACPRCARPSRQRFYGPCASCCEELGASMGGEPVEVEVERAAFEPKMNVVPNFVATKD